MTAIAVTAVAVTGVADAAEPAEVVRDVAASEELFDLFRGRTHQDYFPYENGSPPESPVLVTTVDTTADGRQLAVEYSRTQSIDSSRLTRTQRYRTDGTRSTHFLEKTPEPRNLLIECDLPATPPAVFRPHLAVLPDQIGNVTLSGWLQGQVDNGNQPEPVNSPVKDVRVTGSATVNGFECTVIEAIKHGPDGRPSAHYELALARDRHLIPVRNRTFWYGFSRDNPIDETVVEAFREVEPGVFVPARWRATKVESRTADEPEPTVVFTRLTELEDFTLDPEITAETFAMLEPPEGAIVQTYRGSDLVSERFNDTEGGRAVTPVEGRPERRTPFLPYAAIGLAVLAAAGFAYARRR